MNSDPKSEVNAGVKNEELKKAPMSCCWREHAIAFGHREAVILFHFMFWIKKNRENKKHFHKGQYWSYGSISDLQKFYFPFFTISQLRLGIDSLLEQKALIKDNFNKMKYDKTSWYALSDENRLIEIAIPFDKNRRWDEVQW